MAHAQGVQAPVTAAVPTAPTAPTITPTTAPITATTVPIAQAAGQMTTMQVAGQTPTATAAQQTALTAPAQAATELLLLMLQLKVSYKVYNKK